MKVGEEQWELCNLEPCPPLATTSTTITATRDLLCAGLVNNGSQQVQGEVRRGRKEMQGMEVIGAGLGLVSLEI